MLKFLIANSLTGRLVGRLYPSTWTFTDPLTGSGEGSLTVPLPQGNDAAERVNDLVNLTRPHIRQLCVQDDQGRCWFGGPVIGDPKHDENDTITIPVADWRLWFSVAAPVRPNDDGTRREYVRTAEGGNQVEQNTAIADLAAIGLDTVGAPRAVVDTPVSSGVMRDVTVRMFRMTGEAMNNIARRHNGPDWWTYLDEDPADPMSVIVHLKVQWPERSLLSTPMLLRHEVVLRGQQGRGGNILSHTWPEGNPPPSRVFGVGNDPPPDEKWAIAESPDLAAGERLAWDEVWTLPEGVITPTSAFEHSLARLLAMGNDLGSIEITIDPTATDLGSWGPGDRSRLIINDGWRDIEIDQARIISRTLSGTGGEVTEVKATINLSEQDQDISEPETDLEG